MTAKQRRWFYFVCGLGVVGIVYWLRFPPSTSVGDAAAWVAAAGLIAILYALVIPVPMVAKSHKTITAVFTAIALLLVLSGITAPFGLPEAYASTCVVAGGVLLATAGSALAASLPAIKVASRAAQEALGSDDGTDER